MFHFNMYWDLFSRCGGERTDCQIFSKLFLQDKKRFIPQPNVCSVWVIISYVCLFASACRWWCLAAQLSWLPLPVIIQVDSLELVLVEVSVQQAAKKKNHSWFCILCLTCRKGTTMVAEWNWKRKGKKKRKGSLVVFPYLQRREIQHKNRGRITLPPWIKTKGKRAHEDGLSLVGRITGLRVPEMTEHFIQ